MNKNNKLESYLNSAKYIEYHQDLTADEILSYLKNDSPLAIDIETTSLKPERGKIRSISITDDTYATVAILLPVSETDPLYKQSAKTMIELFKKIAIDKRTMVYHNASFDVKYIIRRFLLNHIDYLLGFPLKVLNKYFNEHNVEDTFILAKILYNYADHDNRKPCGLKALTKGIAGDYALDNIDNVLDIPTDKLLRYNATDTILTMLLYKQLTKFVENHPACEDIKKIYKELLIPSIMANIRCELIGFPISDSKLKEINENIINEQDKLRDYLLAFPALKEAELTLAYDKLDQVNSKLKTKVKTLEDIKFNFNLNSSKQIQFLLYNILNLPVLKTTNGGLPSADKKTIKDLQENYVEDENTQLFLDALYNYKESSKIISSFLPSFLDSDEEDLNIDYRCLRGSFNVLGTLSGRMSSSSPNLQQLPSTGTKLAKIIKNIFRSPKGWLLVGLDYNALEATIMALLTKDPNRLSVYTDGYDSHCLNAYSYFKEEMPDIDQVSDSYTGNCYKSGDESYKDETEVEYLGTSYTLNQLIGTYKNVN